jgi:hypothetical protein
MLSLVLPILLFGRSGRQTFGKMSVNLPSGSIDDSIYTGFWINRSFGVLRGATLTLDRWSGGLLIAFLALYVGATGRGIWTITRFLLHFIFSTELNRDGVYHQRQAILRNAPLAQDAVWELLRITFVWGKRTEAARRRILPAAVLAALISVASVVAGTSKVLLFSIAFDRPFRYILTDSGNEHNERSSGIWPELWYSSA